MLIQNFIVIYFFQGSRSHLLDDESYDGFVYWTGNIVLFDWQHEYHYNHPHTPVNSVCILQKTIMRQFLILKKLGDVPDQVNLEHIKDFLLREAGFGPA